MSSRSLGAWHEDLRKTLSRVRPAVRTRGGSVLDSSGPGWSEGAWRGAGVRLETDTLRDHRLRRQQSEGELEQAGRASLPRRS